MAAGSEMVDDGDAAPPSPAPVAPAAPPIPAPASPGGSAANPGSPTFEIAQRLDKTMFGCDVFAGFVSLGGPPVEQLFMHTSLQRQRKMLRRIVELVSTVTSGKSMDVAYLHRLAVYHAHLGIGGAELQHFGEALMAALSSPTISQAVPGTPSDWERAYLLIARFFISVIVECSQALAQMSRAVGEEEAKAASKLLRRVLMRTYRTTGTPAGEAPAMPASNTAEAPAEPPPVAAAAPEQQSSEKANTGVSSAWTPGGNSPNLQSPMDTAEPSTYSEAIVPEPPPGVPARGRPRREESLQWAKTEDTPQAESPLSAARRSQTAAECAAAASLAASLMAVAVHVSTRADPLLLDDFSGHLWVSQYALKGKRPPGVGEEHERKMFKRRWVQLVGKYLYVCRDKGERPLELLDVGMCDAVDTRKPHPTCPSPSPFSFALRQVSAPQAASPNRSPNRASMMAAKDDAGTKQPTPPPLPPTAGGRNARASTGQATTWFVADGDAEKEAWYERITRARARFNVAARRAAWEHLPAKRHLGDKEWSRRCVPFSPSSFEVLALVGRGAFGTVSKVRETDTGRIFAFKKLRKACASTPALLHDVLRERDILFDMNHPFIVRLHASFSHGGELYLVFDWLCGGDLFTHLRGSENLCFEPARARYHTIEIILALEYLREQDIIHRDVKADNVMLSKEGHCMLTDFGFATRGSERDRRSCGTLAYMAPEVIAQQPCTCKVDWWSLGVLVFIMMTGSYPFLRQDARQTAQAICSAQILFPPQPRVKGAAVMLIGDLLRKSPENRVSSLQQACEQPWFQDVDWDKYLDEAVPPPFVPDRAGSDTKYAVVNEAEDDDTAGTAEQVDLVFAGLHSVYRSSSPRPPKPVTPASPPCASPRTEPVGAC
eukprot:TRINITY_DN26583_c0_g1_i1.p1 TRINITY_DN26583_c0_g1~~TRINITY_DN26583_c0_g1_i1.p1  ORF type:complete len:889 (+),score=126.45 TRINITY_DN26583_c0_g1_i1:59-2725(+)